MDDTTTVIAAALDQVGPRLKRLRLQRGVTLTGLATTTGISKSTLSPLETGQRRPSLELHLPLALAYMYRSTSWSALPRSETHAYASSLSARTGGPSSH